jgi:hypothetical protein
MIFLLTATTENQMLPAAIISSNGQGRVGIRLHMLAVSRRDLPFFFRIGVSTRVRIGSAAAAGMFLFY